MLPAKLLCAFEGNFKQLTGRRGAVEDFGGAHVLFIGDFWQLPPVPMSEALWDRDPGAADPESHESNVGRGIWRRVNRVVQLTKNHRASQDESYASFLSRLRRKQLTARDVQQLNARVVDRIAKTGGATPPLGTPTMWYSNNAVNASNYATALLVGHKSGRTMYRCTARLFQPGGGPRLITKSVSYTHLTLPTILLV